MIFNSLCVGFHRLFASAFAVPIFRHFRSENLEGRVADGPQWPWKYGTRWREHSHHFNFWPILTGGPSAVRLSLTSSECSAKQQITWTKLKIEQGGYGRVQARAMLGGWRGLHTSSTPTSSTSAPRRSRTTTSGVWVLRRYQEDLGEEHEVGSNSTDVRGCTHCTREDPSKSFPEL